MREQSSSHLVWPVANSCTAECVATREEEQAVSTVMAGPRNPKANDRRPDVTDSATPVGGAFTARYTCFIHGFHVRTTYYILHRYLCKDSDK